MSSPVSPSPRGEPAVLPPVVVVVVAHDPGDWFEASLRSIDEQGYANLSVLVVDAGSREPLAPRVAAVMPDAHERRLETNPGFAAAANEVLASVRGAAFYLLCHDDVRLAPNTVKVLVEEAFRSNAGIVGPKLVRWDDPDVLLAVGMGADKMGQPAPMVDEGERDQSQHDTVREVFSIPGAVTLVRSDLFAALGGFDEAMTLHGEDLDLCWRAHVAGARVVVAPAARVAHLEALGHRHPDDDRRRLQMRHRLRAVLSDYGPLHRWRVVPQAALLTLVEVVYAVLLGRFRQARDLVGAWAWNLRRYGQLRTRRRAVAAVRTADDRTVRSLHVRGSARVAGFLRGRIGSSDDRIGALAGARAAASNLRTSSVRSSVVAWAAVIAVLLLGSRSLLTDRLPAIGDFAAFPDQASTMLDAWLRGYRDVGAGIEAPAPPALGLFGAASLLSFGSSALARTLLVLAALPVGVAGAWRLCKPIGSRRARIAGLVVFAANPLMYNALAQGRWSAMVLCALSPWMLLHLARASGVTPYGDVGGPAGPGAPPRSLVHHAHSLGVGVAIAGLWLPVAPLVVGVVAVAAGLGGVLVGQVAGFVRMVVTAVGAAVVAAVLLAPWSLSLAGAPADVLLGASLGDAPDLGVGELLRFQTGPVGASTFGWALLLGASLALLIGRSWRLAWAARGWTIVLASWGAVIAVDQGWVPESLSVPVPEVLLAPAVAGLALAAAMSMASFEVDLPDYHFGWRQVASVVAAAGVAVSLVPVLAAAASGNWDMPDRDVGETLGFAGEEADVAAFRVLWLGDPDVVPLAGWALPTTGLERPGQRFVYGTSDDGAPTVEDLWTAPAPEGTARMGEAVEAAAAGGTTRLGSLLAPMGVRYVIVPDRLGPGEEGVPQGAAGSLVELLQRQLDLSLVQTGAGLRLFRNAAWVPTRAAVGPEVVLPDDPGGPAPAPELADAEPVLPSEVLTPVDGSVPGPSQVYVGYEDAAAWSLEVAGQPVARRPVLGWSMAFDVAAGGDATLAYDTPLGRRLLVVAPLVLWLAAIVYLLRNRVAGDEHRQLDDGGGDRG